MSLCIPKDLWQIIVDYCEIHHRLPLYKVCHYFDKFRISDQKQLLDHGIELQFIIQRNSKPYRQANVIKYLPRGTYYWRETWFLTDKTLTIANAVTLRGSLYWTNICLELKGMTTLSCCNSCIVRSKFNFLDLKSLMKLTGCKDVYITGCDFCILHNGGKDSPGVVCIDSSNTTIFNCSFYAEKDDTTVLMSELQLRTKFRQRMVSSTAKVSVDTRTIKYQRLENKEKQRRHRLENKKRL